MIEFLEKYLNFMYLISFLTLSYTFREIGKDMIKVAYKKIFKKDTEVKNVFIVLIIASILGIPFYFFEPCKECLMKLVLTYCFGTSIYEIFLKNFESYIKGVYSRSKESEVTQINS